MHCPLTPATLALFACVFLTGCQTKSDQPTKLTTEPALDNGRLERFAAALPFDRATVGVRLVDFASGKELYAREPDRPLMPASNLKLLTTATALHLLGPGHTFDTFLAHKGDDLYLIGTGDPALGDPTIASWHKQKPTDHFEGFAKALQDKGLTRIRGNLYYDDHALDEQRIHPSWSKAFRDDWYAAPVAGLNFNDNCIDVTVYPTTPGQPVRYEVVPPTSRIKIVNQCKTSDTAHAPAIRRDTDDYTYVLTGTCKTTTTLQSKPVQDPGHFTADALKTYLESKGITIQGQIQRAPRHPLLLTGPTILATHRSTMKDVLARTNKNSQNMFAEALSKIAGSAYGATSWPNGHKAIHTFLTQLGIDPTHLVAADGSGLSRDNRVTARVMSDLLLAMHPSNATGAPRDGRRQSLRGFAPSAAAAQLWHDSLAEPGGIGTLRNRLKDLAGKLRGKTGSIGGVRTLSGYLTTRENKTLVFSILLNDIQGDETAAVVKVDNALRHLAGVPTSTTAPATQP
jgi:D-alanyl-D-alanine carboxypeptidase/D-alanyl-D-alanine-endopeptidase (penicillin-binding protein 4)